MAAAALLRGTPIVLLVLAHARQSAVVTAFRRDGDHQVMNAVVRGTRGAVAVVPGATQCGRAAPAHRPRHVRVPGLVHVRRRIHLTRVGAGLGLGPPVGGEGVTAGKISETVGRGLRDNFLVSTIVVCKIILSCLYLFYCMSIKNIVPIQSLDIDESSARIGLIRWFNITVRKIIRLLLTRTRHHS